MSDFLKLELAQDPGGARLKGALIAHAQYERRRAIRTTLVHVVALGGGFPFFVAGWPGAVARSTVAFGLALWAVGFVALVLTGAMELRAYRALARYLAPRPGPAGGRP